MFLYNGGEIVSTDDSQFWFYLSSPTLSVVFMPHGILDRNLLLPFWDFRTEIRLELNRILRTNNPTYIHHFLLS